jgi:hypothetical protein
MCKNLKQNLLRKESEMKGLINKIGIIFAIGGLIIFFFSMEGWGADWKYIEKDSQNNVWEIDTASISHQPHDIVRVLVKTTYSKESINNYLKNFGEEFKDVSYSTKLIEYHCIEEKSRTLNVHWYSLGGEMIYSSESPSEWEFVIPDSVGENTLKAACKQPGSKGK